MKKIFLFILSNFILIFSFAQSSRLVLAEDWTSDNCPPSAPSDNYFANLIDPDPTKVVKITDHVSWPNGNEPMYTQDAAENNARVLYYSVPHVPYARMNGSPNNGMDWPYNWNQNRVDSAASIVSPFSIDVSHYFNSAHDSAFVMMIITCTQNVMMATPVFQCVMVEKHIHFATAPGTNGTTDFFDVMRKMYPNQLGTAIATSWIVGQTDTLRYAVPVPNYIYDINQVAFIGFIQDNFTKEVLQAGADQPNPALLDAGVTYINGISQVGCNGNISPVLTINNLGTDTITSLLVKYQVDNGPWNSQLISNTILPGWYLLYNIPVQNFSPGAHTIRAQTSSPNGLTDQNIWNDGTYFDFVILSAPVTIPMTEDFESGIFPPSNWSILNLDHDTTWMRANVGGFGASAHSAEMNFYYYANPMGQEDFLFSPQVDLSATIGNIYLDFNVAYTSYDSAFHDSLVIEVSIDCGTSWQRIYGKADSSLMTAPDTLNNFVPTADQWRAEHIDLSAYAGSPALDVRFKSINAFGNNLYIDDINIHDSTSANSIVEMQHHTSFSIYPNPNNGEMNFVFPAAGKNSFLEIFDATGNCVSRNEIVAGTKNLFVSECFLPDGIYLCRIFSDGNITGTEKMVITK
ncbi:MAG: T9SS type A sorting domain-containing protein [Bacteroidetes bacterium]|nr:T9SS type A sorting domain-containing protein [Bacteroidota bacterium]